MTNDDYLPRGLLRIIKNKYAAIIDTKKITTGRLENWIAISLIYNEKRSKIISVCRIPALSKTDRTYSSLSQY